MNLARIAGCVLNRTGTKWQELELEVYENVRMNLTLSLSVPTFSGAFTISTTVVSYNSCVGEIIVRDIDLRHWNITMSHKVQGPKSWEV